MDVVCYTTIMNQEENIDFLGPESGSPSVNESGITENALGGTGTSETPARPSHTEAPDREAKQLDPIPGNLREYIHRRFTQEKAFAGSRSGGNMREDERAEYIEGL